MAVTFLTNEDREQLEQSIGQISEENAFKPENYGLPILYLTGDISPIKENKDNEVSVDYVYGERSGTCKLKGQGASSYAIAQSLGELGKYNYTIKFDEAFEVVEGWGVQKKYCLKANYIDHSHARNVVCAKMWGGVVKSRKNVSDKLVNLPNGGAIDGFACIIMLNGKFHGLYTWNIPKDGWMYGMDKGGVQTESEVLEFDTYIDGSASNSGEYVATTTVKINSIRKRNTLSGGRIHVNWDTNKVNGFSVRCFLYNSTGELIKVFCTHNGKVLSAYYKNVVGDLGEDAWLDPEDGSRADHAVVNGPFTLPIPEGCTVLFELYMGGSLKYPDGTITPTYSSEAAANNTWSLVWIKTSIEVSVVTEAYEAYEYAAIFGADTTSQPTCFKALATLSGDFDLEHVKDKNNADWALASLNRLISACIDSDGTDLDTTIAQYLDWDSAIDYYVFCCAVGGVDMAGKNYLLYTYDGTKWGFGAYDMDSVFGLWWNGTKFMRENNYPTIQWYANYHRAMKLILTYKKDAFKARYAELRAGVLSEGSVAEAFSSFIATIPSRVYAADVQKWPTIPSSAANNLGQILNWYRMRVAVLDNEVEAL